MNAPQSKTAHTAHLCALSAMLIASVAVSMLGWRSQTSIDLGYHLAYGQQFMQTGQPVDHNDFIYTFSIGHRLEKLPGVGPGCWYDANGQYHFANANWLSQVIMAQVYAIGGMGALTVLNLAMAVSLVGFIFMTMRSYRIAPPVSAMGILLIGAIAYSRFKLRPELFGYVVLAAQAWLLTSILKDRQTIRSRSLIVLVLLQWLFVNLHSYFMLGLGVTGAILIDRLLNRNKADLLIMIKLLAAQTAVCLINPWGWRLAVLPLQTLSYIHTQGIRAGAGEHPWSNILELKPTYHSGFPMSVSHWALLLLWVMTIAAVGFAIKQRRWAMIIIMTAMVFVSLSMRRNIAAAAIVLVPIVLANLKYFRLNPAASIGGALIAITLSIALATSISSNQFYHFNGQPSRFGMGLSRAYLPIDAARWLDKHMPYARVWCDMSSSSTIHFFTRPHREVPILSNTWAYPPAVMAEELAYRATQKPFAQCVNKYGIDAVVLRADWSRPLFLSLLRDTRWVLVHVQSVHVVLVRIDGQYAKLSAQAISNKPVDQNAYIQKLGSVDPFADMSLLPAAQIFTDAKLHDLAIQLCELSTVREPRLLRAWNQLGYALTMRGHNSLKQGNHSGLDDIDQAVLCHEKALTIDPDNIFAHRQLEQLAGIITATR